MQNVTSTASDMTTALCSSTGELRVVARWRSRICSARKVIHIAEIRVERDRHQGVQGRRKENAPRVARRDQHTVLSCVRLDLRRLFLHAGRVQDGAEVVY